MLWLWPCVPTPCSTEPASQDRLRLPFRLCPYYSQWYPFELNQPFIIDLGYCIGCLSYSEWSLASKHPYATLGVI